MGQISHLNEDRFLISLIQKENNTEINEEYKLINTGFDWNYVLDESKKEGIFYPLYRNLSLLNPKNQVFSREIYEKFQKAFYLYISKSTYYYHQVTSILDYIDSQKLNILLLKGPSIDSFIYEDNLFRPRIDLDFAVREKDFQDLDRLFANIEYFPQPMPANYPLFEYINSHVYIKKDNADAIPLHIHRHIVNNSYLMEMDMAGMNMEKIWREAERFKGYTYIYCLGPELQIIHLCEHGLKHNYEQLIYLYEIDKLIEYYGERLNWDKVVSLAREFNLIPVLYYGFYFTSKILSAKIPEDVFKAVIPIKITNGEKQFINNILERKHSSSYPVYLALHNGLFKKAKFIFRTIFPRGFTLKGYFLRLRNGMQYLFNIESGFH